MTAEPSPIRVVLDKARFRQLCAGQVVRLHSAHGEPVELILSDIGVVPMLRAVLEGCPMKKAPGCD